MWRDTLIQLEWRDGGWKRHNRIVGAKRKKVHILCINVIRRKRGVGLCLALLIAADFYLHKDKGCFSFLLLVSPSVLVSSISREYSGIPRAQVGHKTNDGNFRALCRLTGCLRWVVAHFVIEYLPATPRPLTFTSAIQPSESVSVTAHSLNSV